MPLRRSLLCCALMLSAPALMPQALVQQALAQHAAPPRIEDFRPDLPKPEIEAAGQQNLRALASQAYLWGMPLFLHYRQTTEIKQARRLIAPTEEPFGGWFLLRNLASPADRANVLPNVDTLYGAAYLLLDKQGPVVLSLPAIRDRYYSVALHDAYFNTFAVVGARTTGGKAVDVLILPPDFKGKVPGGFAQVIRAPTAGVAAFQRIFTRDAADVPGVRTLQDQIRFAPLATWRQKDHAFPKIASPEFDSPTAVRETRDPLRFFEIVSAHGCRNPAPAAFGALLDAFRRAGLGPCTTLPKADELPKADDDRAAIADGARDAQVLINARISAGAVRNGWKVPDPNTGKASLDYTGRAVVQIHQIASFSPDEAMYFTAKADSAGAPLDGGNAYGLTFAKDGLPPVGPGAFWSLTMYDATTNLLVENPISRYILRPTTPGLTKNADGSLTLHISHRKPAAVPEGNWLPAPAGGFIVVLRTYYPDAAIQSGKWFPPALQKQ